MRDPEVSGVSKANFGLYVDIENWSPINMSKFYLDAPASRDVFRQLQKTWTPFSNGVTTTVTRPLTIKG